MPIPKEKDALVGSMNFEFLKRVLSALILFPLLILLLLKAPFFIILCVILLCFFICLYEWTSLFNLPKPYFLYGFFLISFLFLLSIKIDIFFALFLLPLSSFFPFLINFEREFFFKQFFPFFTGLIYLLVGFYPLGMIAHDYSRNFLVFFFAVVFAGDTGAYLTGKFIGKRPFFNRISPKKTLEGFLGGVFFALLVGLFLNHFLKLFPFEKALLSTLVLSLTGVIGDLFESAVKRGVNKKDSGALIPGHGGLLDRIDSVLFASPIFYLILKLFP